MWDASPVSPSSLLTAAVWNCICCTSLLKRQEVWKLIFWAPVRHQSFSWMLLRIWTWPVWKHDMLAPETFMESYCRSLGLGGSSGKIYETTKKRTFPSEGNICWAIRKSGFTNVEAFIVYNLLWLILQFVKNMSGNEACIPITPLYLSHRFSLKHLRGALQWFNSFTMDELVLVNTLDHLQTPHGPSCTKWPQRSSLNRSCGRACVHCSVLPFKTSWWNSADWKRQEGDICSIISHRPM